jgi:hypothetical protein
LDFESAHLSRSQSRSQSVAEAIKRATSSTAGADGNFRLSFQRRGTRGIASSKPNSKAARRIVPRRVRAPFNCIFRFASFAPANPWIASLLIASSLIDPK